MIYLDNSATTRVNDEVAQLVASCMVEDYGNPSSMHHMGVVAQGRVRDAAEQIAGTLRCKRSEVLFTSGGTESDTQAIRGVAHTYSRKGRHLITTAIEHPAVLRTMQALEREGYEVTYLPVDGDGIVDPETFREALRDDTILASVMAVNNEIGAIEPLSELSAALHDRCPEALFHTDAVQGYGKLPLQPRRLGVDLMSVSGHKLHGPKGVGFLYVRDGIRLEPVFYGGGQQGGLRSGTENVPGIAGMGLASDLAYRELTEDMERLYGLRADFIRRVTASIPDVRINGPAQGGTDEPLSERRVAPHIISLSVEGVRAEVLLHALEEKGIYVSAGSACASNAPHVSDTLLAIGLPEELLSSTIRISMSTYTTVEELTETAQALEELVPMLRRFTRR